MTCVRVDGPVLVVHGGAGKLASQADRDAYRVGVGEALAAGLPGLAAGAAHAARDAVVHMESHTIMNAGRGGVLDAEGKVRLDAGFMEGRERRYGAVTGVTRTANAVRLAEGLLADGPYGRFVAAPASDALVAAFGVPACEPAELETERARRIYAERRALLAEASRDEAPFLDTVGAVALDARGHVVAAVSTGGMSLKPAGRVGDSPVVGAGFWADDRVGACVTTGVGEALLRQGTARRCVQLVADGVEPADAAARALDELVDHAGDTRGLSGLILVTRDGQVVLDHNSFEMSGGWITPGGDAVVDNQWR